MEETRPLADDERAILEWFADQWPELASLFDSLAPGGAAEVFMSADGYRTITLPWLTEPGRLPASPYPGEAKATVDGEYFNAMLFLGQGGLMLELIWSDTWPGRLPLPDELEPVWESDSVA